MIQRAFILLFIIIFESCTAYHAEQLETHIDNDDNSVIYGDDSIINIDSDVLDQVNFKSSVALVKSADLENVDSDNFRILDSTVNELYNTCPEFKYSNEIAPAFCSGVLIGKKRILTAGHCVDQEHPCEDTSFVFDFESKKMKLSNNQIPKNKIFKCKKVIKAKTDVDQKLDYAVIELDRPARLHPIQMAFENNKVAVQTKIYSIGYPLGTAKKKADGVVRSIGTNQLDFNAELDVFSGNSGSPIFNSRTNKLIGILSSGESDFSLDKQKRCEKIRHCLSGTCTGETVIPIRRILKDLHAK